MFERKLFCTGFLAYLIWILTSGNIDNESANSLNEPNEDSLQLAPPIVPVNNADSIKNLQFVKAYLKKNRYGLALIKKRSKTSFAVINKVFSKKDIPVELKYLAIVESGLKADVSNDIGAAGLWQIMPSTAEELGLKITEENDDRLHIYKSTKAIASFLKQLYKEYDDVLLVVAAYNAGPGKVDRAIRLSGSHDFWELEKFLPKETRNHVKKFISIQYYFEESESLTKI